MMELTEDGRRLLERVSGEFLKHGWEVHEHSFITRKGNSMEIDLLGKKGRTFVAVECKVGNATAADIGVLRDVPATHKFVVANGWADLRLAQIADKNSVELIPPNEVEGRLHKLENELGMTKEFAHSSSDSLSLRN
jgi:Holliday junction resolvase-like predicted endonuclease